MLPEPGELFWALLGNVVVGFGAGTATLAAFAPTLPLVGDPLFVVRVCAVSLGFAFFFAGYHITQAGTYRDPEEPLLSELAPMPTGGDGENGSARNDTATGTVDLFLVFRGGFVLLGLLGLGAGMRLFAVTIQSWSPVLGGLAGLVCIGGYICGHIGINGMWL